MTCRRRRRISFRLRRHSGSEIVPLWWADPSTGKTGSNTRAEIVDWIENRVGAKRAMAGVKDCSLMVIVSAAPPPPVLNEPLAL
jgi:hypothetical protein